MWYDYRPNMNTPEGEPNAPKKEPCVHRWVMKVLSPYETRGVCRNCDTVKIYPYWYEDASRNNFRINPLTSKTRRKIEVRYRASYLENDNLQK